MRPTRRRFLHGVAGLGTIPFAAAEETLAGHIGLVAATLAAHQAPRKPDGLSLFDLPRLAREELDLRVLDMNTMNFPTLAPAELERFRNAAADAGCRLTNLKLNQRGLDPGSPDEKRPFPWR